jgi:hypothetical protein
VTDFDARVERTKDFIASDRLRIQQDGTALDGLALNGFTDSPFDVTELDD